MSSNLVRAPLLSFPARTKTWAYPSGGKQAGGYAAHVSGACEPANAVADFSAVNSISCLFSQAV